MIDHIGVGASNFEASRRFYDAALAVLGVTPLVEIEPEQSGGYQGVGYGKDGNASFWLGSDGPRGSGIHIAFSAASRSAVDAFYATAISNGGKDNGAPGLRPHYGPNYYGAYVFDPDGINVEAVCREAV